MAKTRTQYLCQSCGRITPVFMGKCPRCGQFDTMMEQVIEEPIEKSSSRTRTGSKSRVQRLMEVTSDGIDRLSIPLTEFSRVLGGGMVPGSLILVGGDPGIGKSTLLLDVAALVANTHGTVLYVSGEESARQIKMRADRLGLKAQDLFLVTETNMGAILDHVKSINPLLLIVDSIQTTFVEESKSSPGSVSQVRQCSLSLSGVGQRIWCDGFSCRACY